MNHFNLLNSYWLVHAKIQQKKIKDEKCNELELPKLKSPVQEGLITHDEVIKAIGKLNTGKTPGCDGITAEFDHKMAQQVTPFLTASYSKAFRTRHLSASQCLVIVILLYKRGDRLDTANYRPISLTNMDYKILAYVLVNCIQMALEDVISPAQTAYMPG